MDWNVSTSDSNYCLYGERRASNATVRSLDAQCKLLKTKKDHRTEEKYKSPRQAEETSGNVQAKLRPCECL